MDSLLAELTALETELHHPGSPCTRERLERLLHPDSMKWAARACAMPDRG